MISSGIPIADMSIGDEQELCPGHEDQKGQYALIKRDHQGTTQGPLLYAHVVSHHNSA